MYAMMMEMGRNFLIVSIDVTVKQLARRQVKQKTGRKTTKLIFLSSLESLEAE